MNTQDQDLMRSKIAEVLAAPTKVVVIVGTHQFLKYPIAFRALAELALQQAGSFLVRLHTLDQATAGMDLDPWVEKTMSLLRASRTARFNGSSFFLDTVNRMTQDKTPPNLKGAAFYLAERMAKDSDQIEQIAATVADSGKILLATWTDNHDMGWMRGLAASYVVVHTLDAAYHQRMLAHTGHLSEEDYAALHAGDTNSIRQPWQAALDTIHVGNKCSSLSNSSDRHVMNMGLKELYRVMTKKGDSLMKSGAIIAHLRSTGYDLDTAKEVAATWQRILANPSVKLPQAEYFTKKGDVKTAYLAFRAYDG